MLNIAIHREPLHESEKKPQVQSETTVLREALKLKQDIFYGDSVTCIKVVSL